MTFAHPVLLLLILLIPILLLIRARFRQDRVAATFPNLELLTGFRQTWRLRFRWVPTVVGAAALALVLVALARPQNGNAEADLSTEGLDIVLVLDTSSSMSAGRINSQQTNLAEAQRVLKDFISGRENDRLGLVIFREASLILSPLTLDYGALSLLIDDVQEVNLLDGTAIGDGLADGLNLLRESRARSRVAILLTDGQNNAGSIEPLSAARIAETLGIRVYTIGVIDSQGPGLNRAGVDETALQEMARVTSGLYFAAEGQQALEGIYANIDELEKSRIEGLQIVTYNEVAYYFLAAALVLLAVEILLRTTLWRQAA